MRTQPAFDGTNFLVVWQDYRTGDYDIYAARVSPAATVLDPAGIPISARPEYQTNPVLAFDGTNYLVVWEDRRSGTSHDIYGTRVSPAGGILDGGGVAISAATGDQAFPALAFDGTNHIAVWEDGRSGTGRDDLRRPRQPGSECLRLGPGRCRKHEREQARGRPRTPSGSRVSAGGTGVALWRRRAHIPPVHRSLPAAARWADPRAARLGKVLAAPVASTTAEVAPAGVTASSEVPAARVVEAAVEVPAARECPRSRRSRIGVEPAHFPETAKPSAVPATRPGSRLPP